MFNCILGSPVCSCLFIILCSSPPLVAYPSFIYPFSLLRAQCPAPYRPNRTICVPATIALQDLISWFHGSSHGGSEMLKEEVRRQHWKGKNMRRFRGHLLQWRNRRTILPVSMWDPPSPFWKDKLYRCALMVQYKEQGLRVPDLNCDSNLSFTALGHYGIGWIAWIL